MVTVAPGFIMIFKPATKVVQIRDLSQNVGPTDEVRAPALPHQILGGLNPKEPHLGRHAFVDGDLSHVFRRLNAIARDVHVHEVLQQVTVVGGDLDHLTVRAQAQTFLHIDAVGAGVLDPAVRKRGEVGVFGEDLLRRHELVQLRQFAVVADEGVERVERLHLQEILLRHEALAERRHAEIGEAVLQLGSAKTTGEGADCVGHGCSP